MFHFVIQVVVRGVRSLRQKSSSWGHGMGARAGVHTCILGLYFKGGRVLRLPQSFLQRGGNLKVAGKVGEEHRGGQRLAVGAQTLQEPSGPTPARCGEPPPRPALLGNWSPRRR